MNKEEIEKDNTFKISIPLITNAELATIDNNFNNIVDEITKQVVYEKEQIILQHIIKKQADKIEELEEREQKVKDFLENGIKSVQKCYEEMLTDIGGIKVINVTGLNRKEKEEVINKRNCLIVQEHCYKEILNLYKEENNA